MKTKIKRPSLLRQLGRFLYNEFILPVKDNYYKRRDTKELRRAISLANHRSQIQNHKKHVILKNHYGKYQSFSRKEFNIMKLKSHGVFDNKCKWTDILEDAVYITPSKLEIKKKEEKLYKRAKKWKLF